MALDATLLTAAIRDGLLSLPVLNDPEERTFGDVMTTDQKDKMEASISVYAEQIIDHIKTNAVVTVNMASHVHTGVTTGAGSSGLPVATTEIGSIE